MPLTPLELLSIPAVLTLSALAWTGWREARRQASRADHYEGRAARLWADCRGLVRQLERLEVMP